MHRLKPVDAPCAEFVHVSPESMQPPEDRQFEVWGYTVSLGRLLLRSVAHTDGTQAKRNIDIRFLGVTYFDLPTSLGQIRLGPATDAEYRLMTERLGRPLSTAEKVIAIEASSGRYFVVGSGWRTEENDLDRMDTGLGARPPR